MDEQLIGSWELLTFILEKDGKASPWRENVTGLLIYSPDGAMSVAMNSDLDRPEDLFDSILFYSGTWTAKDGYVNHHVANATERRNIGKTLTRKYVLSGETLALSTEGPDFGKATVTFRRRVRHGEE